MLETKERPANTREHTGRSRTFAIAVGVVVVLVVAGIWAVVAATGTDEIDVATELADDLGAAWSGDDPEAVAALYTEDGVHVPPTSWNLGTVQGRDAILAHAGTYVDRIENTVRTGDLTAEGGGRYTYPIEITTADGTEYVGVAEVEVDGDLAARFEILEATFR